MSNLLNLPEEILLLIVKLLDMPSVFNLYNTCNRTRNVIRMNRSVKKCTLSHNTMASAHVLNSVFIRDMSATIQELNLSAVGNLNKTILLTAAKRFKSLQSIDLGYTNITICDFLDIHQHCPTIKEVTINFIFEKKYVSLQLSQKLLTRCQRTFKDFKSIHFIGSQSNLLKNKIVPLILGKAEDLHLQYTILNETKISYITVECEMRTISFKKFYLYFSLNSWKYACTNFLIGSPLLLEENLNACECIFILKPTPLTTEYLEVYCSPLFTDFFSKKFHIDARSLREYRRSTVHNAMFLFWKRDKTVFDDKFFQDLLTCLKAYFPYYFEPTSEDPAPSNYDWFQTTCLDPSEDEHPSGSVVEPTFKRARVGQPNSLLNFDTVFKDKEKIELTLCFYGLKINPRTLSPSCNFLSKLTYLYLKGKVHYSGEFFNVLFRCCDKLETLNFEAPIVTFVKSIARSLPLSKSIKNLRIVAKDMDFQTMISSFSQCQNLENVHLVDVSDNCFEITDPLIMFQKCAYLYCFHIYVEISDAKRTKLMQILNRAKLRSDKPHISAFIINSAHYNFENIPYIEVFKTIITKPFPM
ncbi:uncharacterized protein LOC119833718 [Zerene cesonia]|uniref:uncharacterized protein LOC119833718 n=1 Tax=Zerene cesonia TaxID=33412 RepID=UPI0018E51D38|nr:uncharacterized protein LOC119833718 [Zerene cesonia]